MALLRLRQFRRLVKMSRATLEGRAGLPAGTVKRIETSQDAATEAEARALTEALRRAGIPGLMAWDVFPTTEAPTTRATQPEERQ